MISADSSSFTGRTTAKTETKTNRGNYLNLNLNLFRVHTPGGLLAAPLSLTCSAKPCSAIASTAKKIPIILLIYFEYKMRTRTRWTVVELNILINFVRDNYRRVDVCVLPVIGRSSSLSRSLSRMGSD